MQSAVSGGRLSDLKGQIEWGSGQPDLVGGNPVHGTGLELDDLGGAHKPKPLYDSIILLFKKSHSWRHCLP